jgi:hypothetical protein
LEYFFNSQVAQDNKLIISGDLNFTLSRNEFWGYSARVDPLVGFFLHQLDILGLVDVEPVDLKMNLEE